MMMSRIKSGISQKLKTDLEVIMDKWITTFKNNYSGGKMRGDRGEDIETFVINSINYIGKELKTNLIAKKGSSDKKLMKLEINNKVIKKTHQVDVHVYLNNNFICAIECKAYLDSCYYVRACDDFKLFKKFGYDIKKYIFTLENSIDEDTKIFTDHITDNICDNVFYILDGKRSSSKPIYDERYKKEVNNDNFTKFIESIFNLMR